MSGTVSGLRNAEMKKPRSLSSRNCLIEEIGQEFRSPWPWAALKAMRGIYNIQRMEDSDVAGRAGTSPWRWWRWAGWWKTWMTGGEWARGPFSDLDDIECDPPPAIPDRTPTAVLPRFSSPQGWHLDVVCVPTCTQAPSWRPQPFSLSFTSGCLRPTTRCV